MWDVDTIRHRMCRLMMLAATLMFVACDVEETVTVGALEVTATSDAIHCSFEVIGDTPVDCGFCYATTMTGAESWTADRVKGNYGLRGITGVIEDLLPNTVYFVRGYVMTIRGRVYTETVSVKTTVRAPQADDNEYPDISY